MAAKVASRGRMHSRTTAADLTRHVATYALLATIRYQSERDLEDQSNILVVSAVT